MSGLAALCVVTLVASVVAFGVTTVTVRRAGVTSAVEPEAPRAPEETAVLDSSSVDPALSRVVAVEVLSPPVTPRYLPAVLRYDLVDPYAVRAEFQLPGRAVSWVFARDLVARGLRRPAGHGDVRIWPVGSGGVRIALVSPDGEALMQTDAAEVGDFLDQTYRLCPQGAEGDHMDVEATLRTLLAS